MNQAKLSKIQTYLFAIIILAAIGVRFVHLGIQPLSESEANLAFQAFSDSKAEGSAWSGDPLYLVVTSILFTVFDQTNFIARLVPALFGSIVVFLPVFYRRILGNPVSLLLSSFLAIDAALISLSRTAGGATLTIFLLGVTFLLLTNKRLIGSGIVFGLAVLGGSSVWFSLIPLVIALGIWKITFKPEERNQPLSLNDITESLRDRSFWLSALLSILVFGTFYLIYPRSLSAFPGSLIAYFQAWQSQSPLSFSQLLIGLIVYFPFGLIFGIWGGIRSLFSRNQVASLLFIWFMVGLILLVVNPGKDLSQLAWVSVPVYLLAARKIMRYISVEKDTVFQSVGVSALVVVILVFIWFNLGKITISGDQRQLWLAIGGGLGLLFVSAILIFLGWSGNIAVRGYVWGLISVLTIYSISTGVRTTGVTGNGQSEMLGVNQTMPQIRMVRETINEISTWNAGSSTGIPITIVGLQSNALSWELKEFPNIRFLLNIANEDHPELIISESDHSISFQDQYRGQDFIYKSQIEWSSFSSLDWISWLVHRKTSSSNSTIVMWVRADQFPDGQLSFPAQE